MYFRINPECCFIRGETCGAIYDLIDEKLYALNQDEAKLITSCEKNNPIQGDEKFLSELKQKLLGNFYNNKVYVQRLRVGSLIENVLQPPEIHKAFLEINNSCERDCWFCGYHGIKRSLGCMGCNKWKENGKTLSLEGWKKVINQLSDMNCKKIFIIGGDLTLEWEKTREILDYVKEKSIEIYVTINQKSVSDDIIEDLDGKAKLIIQTDNYNNIISDNFIYLLVTNSKNGNDLSKIQSKNVMIDNVIEKISTLSSDHPMMSKTKVSPVNLYQFWSNLEYHPCLGHTLAICNNGNILPCPMMRDHIIGNVIDDEIYTIFKQEWGRINKFWKLNLDKVEKCTSCEFRYTCSDCRALEESLTGKLDGKLLCNYDPKNGKWL